MKELQEKEKKYGECLKEKQNEIKCLLVSSNETKTQVEDEKAKMRKVIKSLLKNPDLH